MPALNRYAGLRQKLWLLMKKPRMNWLLYWMACRWRSISPAVRRQWDAGLELRARSPN
jgi:hypothetical protein